MSSIFKDFDKETNGDAAKRYVNTPTYEQMYETDKKAIDAFLDGDKAAVQDSAEKISKKEEKEITGTEQLYLKVANALTTKDNKSVEGTEGLFSAVWSLVKRFLGMIGNFFKWIGETFFGFGKRSKTDYNKLKSRLSAGEINYDAELTYPADAKVVLNSKKHQSYPDKLDWLRVAVDNNVKAAKGTRKAFTHAKDLFAKVQNKDVSANDVEAFAKGVTSALEGKMDTLTYLTGNLWITTIKQKDGSYSFESSPAKQITSNHNKFSVTEGVYKQCVDSLEKSYGALMDLANISKEESTLFNVKIKTEKDLEGMGKSEAYNMAAAFRSLVSFISFIKQVMSAIQRIDSASHDIMEKAFK